MQTGRRNIERRPAVLAGQAIIPAVAVAVTGLLVFGLVRATGGLPNAFNNLSFLAIIIGSLGYGAAGGLGAAVLVAALLGRDGSSAARRR